MSKLKFAVVGVGEEGIGNRHSEAVLQHKETELTAICEINGELAKKKAELYGAPFYCTDYKDLLGRDDVDAVIICTPDKLHHTMVADFLDAGKHVLCEKPITLHNYQSQVILDAEKRSSAKFMVGQVCRKTPAFILAKKLVDEGVIGELTYVESEYAHDYSHMKNSWRQDKEDPRHIVTGGACHSVDLLRWIAGNPTEAFAYASKKYLDDNWSTDDTAAAVLKFPNGVIGRIFASMGVKGHGTGIRTLIYGTKGVIKCSAVDQLVTLNVTDFNGTESFMGHKMEHIDMNFHVEINNHNVYGELCDFVDTIINNKPSEIPAIEGANTVSVCEAIVKSTETGKAEQVEYLTAR